MVCMDYGQLESCREPDGKDEVLIKESETRPEETSCHGHGASFGEGLLGPAGVC